MIATTAGYVLAVGWIIWPLPAYMATHIPGTAPAQSDQHHAIWALAWQAHALATAPSTFLDANIYYPAKHTLLYTAASLGSLPYFAPTFLATGNPALAINVEFLGGVVLTAACLHMVAIRWTGSWLAGAIAGTTFVCTRWVLWEWLPAAPQYATLLYFPLIILLAAAPVSTTRGTLTLVALVVLQALTDLVYVATAVFAPLAVLAAIRLLRPATWREGARLCVVLALALLALAPVYSGLLWVRLENPDLANQSVWGPLWVPVPMARTLFGRLVAIAVPTIAFVLIAAGLVSRAWQPGDGDVVRKRAWQTVRVFAIVGTCLTLPMSMRWWGYVVRHPVYHAFPVLQVVRVPARLGVAGLMGLALAAGLGFFELARRIQGWIPGRRATGTVIVLAVLVAGVMYVDLQRRPWSPIERPTLPERYPVVPTPNPESRIIAAIRGIDGPLVEVPIDRFWGADPNRHALAMYRSIFHWHPVLNGYGSYFPHGFLERMRIVQRLPAPDAVEALWRETGLACVLVHTADMGERQRDWMAIALSPNGSWLRLIARERDDLLFAVQPPAGR